MSMFFMPLRLAFVAFSDALKRQNGGLQLSFRKWNCRHFSESPWGHFQGQTSQTQKTSSLMSQKIQKIVIDFFFLFFLFFIILKPPQQKQPRQEAFFGSTICNILVDTKSQERAEEISSNLVQKFSRSQRWSDEILAAKIHMSRSLWPPDTDNKTSFYVIYCHLAIPKISGGKPVPMLEVSLVVYTPQHLNKFSLDPTNQPQLCHIAKKVFFSMPW